MWRISCTPEYPAKMAEMNKIIFSCYFLFGFSILQINAAGNRPFQSTGETEMLQNVKNSYKKDSSRQKDSLPSALHPVNDPKKGFKNLFTEDYGSGLNKVTLNPQAISFVEDYIRTHGKKMEEIRSWGKPYFDMMDAILTQHGLPKELKYLAVIESHLQVYARSWAGAVGPWQFMPATARRLGLKVSHTIDERTNYQKSTHAAAIYLTELYGIYEDWLLVIAAYNGGPGNVNSAIRRSGSRDFWVLQRFLPLESRNHVKKFIATHYIMEGNGGVTTLTRQEIKDALLSDSAKNRLTEEEMANTLTLELTGKYISVVIAKHLSIDISEFNRLNPEFDKRIVAEGKYIMRLPREKMELFRARRNDILKESVQVLLNSLK